MVKDIWQLIYLHEGKRNYPYVDTTGNITIGIGHNLTANGIPDAIVEDLFTADVNKVMDQLTASLPWSIRLDAVRWAVLVDMCFNLGLPKLLAFKATLALIKKRDYVGASNQMLKSKWARQVKTRATRLSNMMLTGEWPDA